MPVVSVIVPTFNRWPLVGEAVESVLAQNFSDFELMVVDDGSTDNTVEELAKFGARLRVLSTARAGVAAARNFAATQAGGRYLAFLDSDDLWLPRKLEIQTLFLERHPEVKICQTEETWIRNGVRVNPKLVHKKPSGDIFTRSLELCLVSPSAVMMTRDLFTSLGGFDESFPVCEDYDLWLRVALNHPVRLITQPLVVKRGGHADQLSRSIWGMDRYRVAALVKLLRCNIDGERRSAALAVLRRKVMILARGSRKRGKEREATEFEAVLYEFDQENLDVGSRDPQLCAGEKFSFADPGALA